MWGDAFELPGGFVNRVLALCVLCLSLPVPQGRPQQAALENFAIDPGHSTVAFAVKHMVITTVRGRFTQFSGEIKLDETDLAKSSARIVIQSASIESGLPKRDDDLRSADFLDVAKFPQITFTTDRIEKSGDAYYLVGPLTMRGVSKEVRIPFTLNGKAKDASGHVRLGASGSLQIDRRQWGISYSKVLDNGGLIAANEVQIQLDIEAKKK
jgi:polyisoprenoid-binding protein YceI